MQGFYGFWSVKPAPYPVPSDGALGELLAQSDASAHIHVTVSTPGHCTLITHVSAAGGPHLEEDAVSGVKEPLFEPFTAHPQVGPAGRTLAERCWQVVFNICLALEEPA